ncbi:hypothetical protein [Rhodococcus sp. NPDC127528]|uniref:hypothetical protein n=1 Tax=Rhodococcus sp. NPDC127528 TaxID=3345395 RepID=UPI00363947F5
MFRSKATTAPLSGRVYTWRSSATPTAEQRAIGHRQVHPNRCRRPKGVLGRSGDDAGDEGVRQLVRLVRHLACAGDRYLVAHLLESFGIGSELPVNLGSVFD